MNDFFKINEPDHLWNSEETKPCFLINEIIISELLVYVQRKKLPPARDMIALLISLQRCYEISSMGSKYVIMDGWISDASSATCEEVQIGSTDPGETLLRPSDKNWLPVCLKTPEVHEQCQTNNIYLYEKTPLNI